MKHHKIFNREDGSQALVTVSIFVDTWRETHHYNWGVEVRDKGKRKWNKSKDLHLSMGNEVQEVALELWEKIKPKIS